MISLIIGMFACELVIAVLSNKYFCNVKDKHRSTICSLEVFKLNLSTVFKLNFAVHCGLGSKNEQRPFFCFCHTLYCYYIF